MRLNPLVGWASATPYPRAGPPISGEFSGISHSTARSHCCRPMARESRVNTTGLVRTAIRNISVCNRLRLLFWAGRRTPAGSRPGRSSRGVMDMAMGVGNIWPAGTRSPKGVGTARRVGIVVRCAGGRGSGRCPRREGRSAAGWSWCRRPADCALRAYEGDIRAAGFADARGNTVALDQGLDMCGLMDRGLSRPGDGGPVPAGQPGTGSERGDRGRRDRRQRPVPLAPLVQNRQFLREPGQ